MDDEYQDILSFKDDQVTSEKIELNQSDSIEEHESEGETILIKTNDGTIKTVRTDEMDAFEVEPEETDNYPARQDWNQKYMPKRIFDIIGNRNKIDEIEKWFRKFVKMDTSDGMTMGLIVTGPTGVGKTSSIYAMCEQFGFEVIEIEPSLEFGDTGIREKSLHAHTDNNPKNFVDALIKTIISRRRLPGEKPIAILIEQVLEFCETRCV